MAQYILATDGRPFRDRDAAQIKRELMAAELGASATLAVVDHPQGGYAVRYDGTAGSNSEDGALAARPAPGAPAAPSATIQSLTPRVSARAARNDASRAPRSAAAGTVPRVPESSAPPSAASAGPYPESFTLHPSPRAFLGQHLLALIGVFFVLQPHLVFRFTHLRFPHNEHAGALILSAVVLAGALLALMSVTRFLWAFSANTYRIDREGVEQTQWYFQGPRLRRRKPRVNFRHMRTADVEQTLMQMLLGVGALKLASGGTDYYDIELDNIRDPQALQAEFQRRARRLSTGPLPPSSYLAPSARA